MTQSQLAHVTISAPTRLRRTRAGSQKVISLLLGLSVSLISCADSADEAMDLMSADKISTSRLRDNLRVLSERAALRGIYQITTIAGIANAETGLAHCWADATWACQGPASSSCVRWTVSTSSTSTAGSPG